MASFYESFEYIYSITPDEEGGFTVDLEQPDQFYPYGYDNTAYAVLITYDDTTETGAKFGDSADIDVFADRVEYAESSVLWHVEWQFHTGTYLGFLPDYGVIIEASESNIGYETLEYNYLTSEERILESVSETTFDTQYFLLSPTQYIGGSVVPAAALDSSTPFTCFAPGTRITTPQGPRPIESLRPGDAVTLADGSHAPLIWVGQQTIAHRFATPERCALVQVAAGALGNGLPRRDLTLTSDHALFLDGLLVHAGALVNGASIRRLHPSELPEQTIVYHLELATQALILAEGCPSESFVDNLPRAVFDNAPSHPAGTQAPRIAPLPYPRVLGKRQLPPALRRRLAAAPLAA